MAEYRDHMEVEGKIYGRLHDVELLMTRIDVQKWRWRCRRCGRLQINKTAVKWISTIQCPSCGTLYYAVKIPKPRSYGVSSEDRPALKHPYEMWALTGEPLPKDKLDLLMVEE